MIIPFGKKTSILIKRRAVGSYNAVGEYAPGSEVVTSATASVQPVTGAELEQMDRGDRSRKPLRIYTTSIVIVGDDIEIDGVDYEVSEAMDYTTHSFLRHYKVIALRKTYEGQR